MTSEPKGPPESGIINHALEFAISRHKAVRAASERLEFEKETLARAISSLPDRDVHEYVRRTSEE